MRKLQKPLTRADAMVSQAQQTRFRNRRDSARGRGAPTKAGCLVPEGPQCETCPRTRPSSQPPRSLRKIEHNPRYCSHKAENCMPEKSTHTLSRRKFTEIPRHVRDYKEFLLRPFGVGWGRGRKTTFIQKKRSSDKYFEIAFYLRLNAKLLTEIHTSP